MIQILYIDYNYLSSTFEIEGDRQCYPNTNYRVSSHLWSKTQRDHFHPKAINSESTLIIEMHDPSKYEIFFFN